MNDGFGPEQMNCQRVLRTHARLFKVRTVASSVRVIFRNLPLQARLMVARRSIRRTNVMNTHRHLLLAAVFSGALVTFGQTIGNYVISPLSGPQFALDRGAGETLFLFEHFAWPDSSTTELIWTDGEQAIEQGIAFKLPGNSIYMQDLIAVNDGYLLTGGFDSPPHATLVGEEGTMKWTTRLMNDLPVLQGQYGMQAVARPNGSSLYAYSTDFSTNAIVRVDLDTSGMPSNGVTSLIPAIVPHRMCGAVPTDDPSKDLVFGGSAYDPADFGEVNVMIGEFGADGSHWMKFYDMEPFVGEQQFEEMWTMHPLSDGNFICGGSATEAPMGTWHGFLMKVDPTGEVIWARMIEDVVDHRYTVRDVAELPDGGLVLVGDIMDSADVSMAMVSTHNAEGALLWSSRYAGSDPLGALFFTGIADETAGMRLLGSGKFVMLDQFGNGCDFVPSMTLVSSAIDPAVTIVPRTNTPFVPVSEARTAETRPLQVTITQECLHSAAYVHEDPPADHMRPFPVPTDADLWLGRPGVVAPEETVIVRDALGAIVVRTRYDRGLDLGRLASGAYLLEIPSVGKRYVVVRR